MPENTLKEIKIYMTAMLLAIDNRQIVGGKNDFYITLEQLNDIIKNSK